MTLDEARAAFPVGSVVMLKSGGPNMTVVEVGTRSRNQDVYVAVRCEWFTKSGALEDAWAAVELLQKAEKS
jgi:uncharacterized protein YodC (DUF2158 family)